MPGMQQNSPHTDRPFSQTQTDKKKSLHEYLTCPIRRRRVSSPRRCHVMSNSPFFAPPSLPSLTECQRGIEGKKKENREKESLDFLSFSSLKLTTTTVDSPKHLFLGGAGTSSPSLARQTPPCHLLPPLLLPRPRYYEKGFYDSITYPGRRHAGAAEATTVSSSSSFLRRPLFLASAN